MTDPLHEKERVAEALRYIAAESAEFLATLDERPVRTARDLERRSIANFPGRPSPN